MTTTTVIIVIICLANMIIGISGLIAGNKNRKKQKYIHLCDDIFDYLRGHNSGESLEIGFFVERDGESIDFQKEIKKNDGNHEILFKKLAICYSIKTKKEKREINVFLIKRQKMGTDFLDKNIIYHKKITIID